MRKLVRAAFAAGALLIVGSALLAGLRGAPEAPEAPEARRMLTVAAASDLKFALDELLGEFRARHPGADVRVTYGSSGNFFAQLSQGAPFDVYLSADAAWPRRLAEQGLVHGDDVFLYAVGRLALWVPRGSALPVEARGLEALRAPGVRRIAIANPRHAPYGQAAEAALRHAGLLEALGERLVLGENVAQAAQFVQSGAADAGLIALSLALAPALRQEGRHWEVPADTYPRLEQGGAILKQARDVELAVRFREFLMGPEGRAVLGRYGFAPPEA